MPKNNPDAYEKTASKTVGRAVSRMVGSGLAGVTAGTQAAVAGATDRAKSAAEARDALAKEENEYRYANLAQQAKEGQANRQLSLYLNRQSSAPSTPGLDVFGQPLSGSAIAQQLAQSQRALDLKAKEIDTKKAGTDSKKQTATSAYPNIGQDFPGLF